MFANTLSRRVLAALCFLAMLSGVPVWAQEPSAAPAADEAAKASEDAATANEDQEAPKDDEAELGQLRFNFQFSAWKPVLEWFAEQADLSLQMDDPPPGTFNYTDNTRSYSVRESLDLINGVLQFRGYTLVRNKQMLLLINVADDGLPQSIIETVTPEALDERGKYEQLKCLFPLGVMTAEQAEAEIRPLVPDPNGMKILPASGQILIQETGGNLRMIRAVIKAVQESAGSRSNAVQMQELNFTTPEEVMAIARPLLGIEEEEMSTEDGSLNVAYEPFGLRIFFSGKPEMIQRFQQILEKIDVDPKVKPGEAPEPLQLITHSVRGGDPQTVLDVLRTLFAGQDGVRLAKDETTGSIIAMARTSQHATIKATIEQMERDAVDFEVIQLNRYDPQSMVLMLNKLLGKENAEGAGTGPTFDGDATAMQLVVRGSAAEIAQIKQLVDKMDPAYDPEGDGVRPTSVLIPLAGGQARDILDLAQLMWPTSGRENKIREVLPKDSRRGLEERETRPRDPAPVRRRPTDEPVDPEPATEQGTTQPDPNPEKEARRSDRRPSFQLAGNRTIRVDRSQQPKRRSSVVFVDRAARDKARRSVRQAPQPVGRPVEALAVFQPAPAERKAVEENKNAKDGKTGANVPADSTPPKKEVAGDPEPKETGETADGDSKASDTVTGAEIVVNVLPQGILITSDDLAALDEYEDLIRSLMSGNVLPSKPTIFYLKNAKAPEAAALLQQILGLSSGGGGGGGGGIGGLVGDMASNLVGGVGGDLLGGLLGGGGGGSSSSSLETTGTVRITPDVRLNAVIVQANAADLDLIEQLLDVVDQESPPQEPDTAGRTYIIPIYYMDANQMAGTVRSAFPENIVGASGSSQQRQPSPQDLLRAFAGRGRGGGGNQQTAEPRKMTLGVDARSNSLVVTGPDHLYKKVLDLVDQLDVDGLNPSETVSVITLKGNLNPEMLKNALGSILGTNVQANTNSSSTQPGATPQQPGGSGQQQQATQQALDAARRFEMFRSLQQRGGGQGRGASPFGQGRGGPGGSTQGRGGSPFGRAPGGRSRGGR